MNKLQCTRSASQLSPVRCRRLDARPREASSQLQLPPRHVRNAERGFPGSKYIKIARGSYTFFNGFVNLNALTTHTDPPATAAVMPRGSQRAQRSLDTGVSCGVYVLNPISVREMMSHAPRHLPAGVFVSSLICLESTEMRSTFMFGDYQQTRTPFDAVVVPGRVLQDLDTSAATACREMLQWGR